MSATSARAFTDQAAGTRVLFIGGIGRSGSTLLERLLAGIPGVVPVGEVRHLWERGLRANELCGCGRPFQECEFWRAVGDEAFGGWHRREADEAVARARAVDRHRHVPALVAGGRRRRGALDAYGSTLARLFEAVRIVSGAKVVVDASKDPPHGFVLGRIGALDLRVVHLIRDSRGVAYSWGKVVPRPDAGNAPMARMSPGHTGLIWSDANLLMELLGHTGPPTLRIRYEDIVEDPPAMVRSVMMLAGVALDASWTPTHAGVPAVTHAIGGNPIRFRHDIRELQLDDEWKRRMRPRDRRIVTVLTAPLLRRYGYGPVLSSRRQVEHR